MSKADIPRMSDPDVSKTSGYDVQRWRPQEVPWMSEIGWDEWNQNLTKLRLLNLTSLDQFMDTRLVFWRLLDILRTSVMSCKCRDLTRNGHAGFWPKYDFPTSPGRQECLGKVRFRPNLELVAWYPESDIHRMSHWRPNWCPILMSMDGKKVFTKRG